MRTPPPPGRPPQKKEPESRSVEKRALFRYKTSPSPAASRSTDPSPAPPAAPRPPPARAGLGGDPGAGAAGSSPPRGGARGGDAARGQLGAGTPRRSRPDRFRRAGAGLRPPHPVPPPPVAPSRRGRAGAERIRSCPPPTPSLPTAAPGLRQCGVESGWERPNGAGGDPEPNETSPRGGLLRGVGGGTAEGRDPPPSPAQKAAATSSPGAVHPERVAKPGFTLIK